jgi:UTP--glucose-1-phosphate uridylyltransferase
MLDIHQKYETTVLGVKLVTPQEVSRYGIIASRKIANRVYQVTDLVEKPAPEEAPSNLAIIGRYVLMPEIFGILEKTQPGRNQEIQLTDGLCQMLEQQHIYAYEFAGKCYDLGTPSGWLEAQVEFALKDSDIAPAFRDYLKKKLREAA